MVGVEQQVLRTKREQQLLDALEAVACAQGFDLVDLELTGSGAATLLRVYISREGSLSLDDVAAANGWISSVVDALDPVKGSYTLEVSSPGIDRPLRTLAHFKAAVGEEAHISLSGASKAAAATPTKSERRGFTGIITGVDEGTQQIHITCKGEQHTLPFSQITKARIKGKVDFTQREEG